MCFSVSSGLPLGKEGPMIHTGTRIPTYTHYLQLLYILLSRVPVLIQTLYYYVLYTNIYSILNICVGSIVGAVVSQGNKLTLGFDTSWTKFQDLRNDRTKRDFVYVYIYIHIQCTCYFDIFSLIVGCIVRMVLLLVSLQPSKLQSAASYSPLKKAHPSGPLLSLSAHSFAL